MNSEIEEISEGEFHHLEYLEFHKALFLLRVFYKKMLDVIEVFCGKSLCIFRDEDLNFCYMLLKKTVDCILELKGFENLKKEKPELFENLIGDIEEADLKWKHGGSQQAYKFLGKIEELYFSSGSKSFKLPQILTTFLKRCDKAIESHLKAKREWEKEFLLKLRTIKKEYPEFIEKPQKEIFKKEIISKKEKVFENVKNREKRPFCVIEGGFGYLKFEKYGEKIKIGRPHSRHFRLLRCLLEPFGVAKTIEEVYEWIKLPKDRKDPDLTGWDPYKKKCRQLIIIQNTIKELQKGNKLRGKLVFKFDDTKSKLWVELLE